MVRRKRCERPKINRTFGLFGCRRDYTYLITSLLRLPMARPDFRELLAWVLFATVTVVYLHSRTQLELCMTQLASSRKHARANTAVTLLEDSGPSERSNAILSDEPSGAVGYAGPLPDVVDLPDGTSGRNFWAPISCAPASARMERRSIRSGAFG